MTDNQEKTDRFDWEQKFEALNNLDPCALKMRGPGVWYVLQSIEIKTGHRMSCVGAIGATPQDAVESYWTAITDDLAGNQCIVARSGRPTRLAVRWNGFMWSPVDETARRIA
jgi:hypothetical protein